MSDLRVVSRDTLCELYMKSGSIDWRRVRVSMDRDGERDTGRFGFWGLSRGKTREDLGWACSEQFRYLLIKLDILNSSTLEPVCR